MIKGIVFFVKKLRESLTISRVIVLFKSQISALVEKFGIAVETLWYYNN